MPSTRSAEPDDVDKGEELEAGAGEAAAAQSAGVVATLTGADVSTPVTVAQLPTPYDVAETVTSPLDDEERAHLAVCEQALHGFRKSVIVAGKALDIINRARLYRETHATFADYVDEVWEMKRAHAYRMIEGWRPAALVSPIGDINEAQARELAPTLKEYGPEVTVALYRGVQELRGDRKVTAADLAEARAVLPPAGHLARPDQVRDVLTVAAAEGRVPRLAPAEPQPQPQVPAQASDEAQPDGGDIGQGELDEGAEAIGTMERALAQQRQIYDAVGGGVLAAALLYDPGRGERLRHELRQYANRTAHRMRDRTDEDAATPGV
ncbi:hypothetical protein [Streptomyces sp. NBC_01689]|uniref:hypothetical protein n=1 Tax=Streptomyces sp. NBC_01689 TaxID=2975911 RepID=UPI002E2F3922|nr:hypothetical protein [Streptomyces sp. NBC_01689]